MAAKEVIKSSDNYRYSTQSAVSHFDVQAVFNKHATKEDAIESVSMVPERSLVFVESFQSVSDVNDPCIIDALEYLALSHMSGGIDDRALHKNNAFLSSNLDEYVRHAPSGEQFQLQLYSSLLEKECYILRADYAGPSSIGREGIEFLNTVSALAGGVVNNYITSGEVKQSIGVYRHAKHLYTAAIKLDIFHHMRESAAIGQMVYIMDLARRHQLAPYLDRSDEGLLSTSVIYGTSHKNSLTRKMKDVGMNVTPTVLNSIHEADCIGEKPRISVRRSLGYQVLRSVYGINTFGVNQTEEYTNEIKDKLYLYATDVDNRREERWDMMARGIRSLHEMSHGRKSGFESAEQLIDNVVSRADDMALPQ